MTSRKPPSQRNTEYADRFPSRQHQSANPGYLGGRWATAAPVPFSTDEAASFSTEATSTGGGGDVLPKRDRFELAVDGGQNLELTYVPVDESEHLYRWTDFQDFGTDWTRVGTTVSVQDAMRAKTGDIVTVMYLYRGGQEIVPAEPVPDLGPYVSKVWIKSGDISEPSTWRLWFKIERWFDRVPGTEQCGAQFHYAGVYQGGVPTGCHDAPEVGAKGMKGAQTSPIFYTHTPDGAQIYVLLSAPDTDTYWPGWRASADYNGGVLWEFGDSPITYSGVEPPATWAD